MIILAIFVNGWSLNDSTKIFEKLVKLAFKRRKVFNIHFLSRALEFLVLYFADCLYSAENIEVALKEVFSMKNILDCSHVTSTGTRIGLPVATVDGRPSCYIFTNYNGVGERSQRKGKIAR